MRRLQSISRGEKDIIPTRHRFQEMSVAGNAQRDSSIYRQTWFMFERRHVMHVRGMDGRYAMQCVQNANAIVCEHHRMALIVNAYNTTMT